MIVDSDTGEIMFDKFAKMFFDDIEKLFSLTEKQSKLLMLMVKTMKIGNNNRIEMTPKRKKEFANIIGVTTSNSVSNNLRAMEQIGVIKREEDGGNMFVVNPSLFFKGTDYQHAQVLMSYNDGKRSIKAFSNKEELSEYLSL